MKENDPANLTTGMIIGVESKHIRYISGQIHLLFMLGERDLDNTDDTVLVYPFGKFM